MKLETSTIQALLRSSPSTSGLISSFASAAQTTNTTLTGEVVTALQEWLNGGKLRYYVSDGAGLDNQAGTVDMMKRLLALGITNDIELIYDAASSGKLTVAQKLATLLPGLDPDSMQPYALGSNTTITFFPYANGEVAGLDGELPLCINGGSGNGSVTAPNLAEIFDVDFYLQIQPYMAEITGGASSPGSLLLPRDAEAATDLSTQASLQDQLYSLRALARQTPEAPDWDQLAKIPETLANQTSITAAKVISEAVSAGKILAMPLQGFVDSATRSNRIIGKAADMTFQLVAGTALTQTDLAEASSNALKKPIVMMMTDELQTQTWSRIETFFPLAGEKPTRPAAASGQVDSAFETPFDETVFRVQSWCYQQGLVRKNSDAGRIYFRQAPTAAELSDLLPDLESSDLLLIGTPDLPRDALDYLNAIAGLPPVFADAATTNLMLNLGKPFFRLSGPRFQSYPSAFGNGNDANAAMASATAAALQATTYNDIQLGYNDFRTGQRNGARVKVLATVIADIAKGELDYTNYFDSLPDFFGTDANDKLLQGLGLLLSQFAPVTVGPENSLREIAAKAIAAGTPPLEALNDLILQDAKENDGVLSLIPTIIETGPLAEFIKTATENPALSIGTEDSPVQVDFPEPGDTLTVTGRTSNFQGTSLEISFVFTDNENGKDIDMTFTLAVGEVSFDGIEWFALDALQVDTTIPGNGDRMDGLIACTIALGDNPVSFEMAFPSSADGKVVIDGDFSENPPSLNDLFSLLGGMNFMSTLPSQISAAGGITLEKLKFGYDFSATAIDCFELALTNEGPWPLFGKLSLENMAFDIAMIEPTGARDFAWNASTLVRIGDDDGGAIKVAVSYPDLTVTAALDEDGPAIPVGDMLTFFLPEGYTLALNADLANFDMMVQPGDDSNSTVYQISAGLEPNDEENGWELDLGIASSILTDIFIEVEGTGSEATGSLTANTVLGFPSDDDGDLNVDFSLTAAYEGDGVWYFTGTQGDTPIKVLQILKGYLPSAWSDSFPTDMNLDIEDVAFALRTPPSTESADAAKSYMVGGSIRIWDTPLGDSFETVITAQFGSGSVEAAQARAALASRAVVPVLDRRNRIVPMRPRPVLLTEARVLESEDYGLVSAEIVWNNIELTLYYNYNPDNRTYGFTWGPLTAEIDSADNTATMTFTDDTTLGAMVETFVSWMTGYKFGLPSPWNVLSDITLSGFKLIWDFDTNEVTFSVDIGPLNLIFAEITGFSVTYQPKNKTNADGTVTKQGVHVSLLGSFPFMAGSSTGRSTTNALTGNLNDPDDPIPTPPGGGSKYLDLRMLAAGQHVEITGLNAVTSVPEAIELLTKMPIPEPNEPLPISFDATNNWMFGADFGILKVESNNADQEGATPGTGTGTGNVTVRATDESGETYTFTLQIVLNDPTLYALRIALAKNAPAAKIFAGLDFQIMYRKLTDSLGVFSAEIVLPEIMRRIDVGAVTITLPTFGVEIYTNGDFQFDIGFPWEEDFSRSFQVEAIIPPGIPVLGAGGFYFGKLPAIAVEQLPVATNGFFNPNLVFGFGAQIGLGKSLDLGILQAGFSLTVFGIIEGILAKWNPYEVSSTGSNNSVALEEEYYFWLRGTFGILGHLYGTVDFVVVKASVDIKLKVYVQITLEAYAPIPVTVSADVTASASLSINMGLFKIKLSFSFSVGITETFEIGYLQDPDDAPWITAETARDLGRLYAPSRERRNLRSHNMVDARGLRLMRSVVPDWSLLSEPSDSSRADLSAYLGYGLTVAGDKAFPVGEAPDTSAQFAAYVASLFIDAPDMAREEEVTSRLRGISTRADAETSFEALAKMVARWGAAAVNGTQVTPEEADAILVDDETLAALIDHLSETATEEMPIGTADIEQFLERQFRMTATMPSQEGEAQAAYFPMPLNLTLSAPGISYSFGDYNTVEDKFVSWLRDYFNQLAVQVQEEETRDDQARLLLTEDLSLAGFIQGDYFVLIMRQMLQGMRESMRDFKVPLTSETVPSDIIAWANETGQLTGGDIEEPVSLYDLFKTNESLPLTAGKEITLPYVTVTIAEGNSFGTLSDTPEGLARQNADMAGILINGVSIVYDGTDYITSGSESMASLAGRMDATLEAFFAGTDILTRTDILQPLAKLTLPAFGYTVESGDTLASLAADHGITVSDLAGVARDALDNPAGSTNGDIAGLFDAEVSSALDLVYLPRFPVGELISEIQRTGGIDHLSGMVSRYYMHGLRLPTEKITPKAMGMWVTDNDGTLELPDYAGLYALTGQQIAVTDLPLSTLTFTLGNVAGVPWMRFADATGTEVDTLDFDIVPPKGDSDGDDNYARLKAVFDYARGTLLPAGPREIAALAEAELEPARYPMSLGITWQSTAAVAFPNGNDAAITEPRVWPLPAALTSLSLAGSLDAEDLLTHPSPVFKLQKSTTDVTTGLPVDTDMQTYGWASYISFNVRKLPESSTATAAQSDTYEITGASAADTVILERIVQYVTEDTDISSICVGYQTASSSTGEVLRAEGGSSVIFGISQSNLSTITQPPAGSSRLALLEEPEPTTLLNAKTELVRLLWEASITRAGGFFLYYHDTINGGLPDVAFNDKGEAVLQLVIQYENQPRLQPWMNAIATGDPIDTAGTAVMATTVSAQIDQMTTDGDSLTTIAKRSNSSILSVIRTTSTEIDLKQGAILRLVNATYRVSSEGDLPGGQLTNIATYFAMDPQAIRDINPRVPEDDWTAGLVTGTGIRLPSVSRLIGTDPGGTTLQAMASYYGTSASALAGQVDNAAATDLLAAGQTVSLMSGPLSQHGSQAAGVQPVTATRNGLPDIPDQPGDAGFAESFLLNDFTLLSFKVAETYDFIASNLGLPLSQQGETGEGSSGKLRFVRELSAEDDLIFKTSVPYVDLAKDAGANPYDANGRMLTMEFGWNDLYGNLMVSTLSDPTDATAQLNGKPTLTGYTDTVIGVAQWPSIASSWTVAETTGEADDFEIQLSLSFDPDPYQPGSDDSSEAWRTRAAAGLKTLTTVLNQLTDPAGVRYAIDTTLLPDPVDIDQAQLLPAETDGTLAAWLTTLVDFLEKQTGDAPVDEFNGDKTFTLTLTAPKADVPADQVFKLSLSLTIARTGGVAEGDFSAIAAVRSSNVKISPCSDLFDSEGTDSTDVLASFAKALGDVLSVPGANRLTVSTGPDRYTTNIGSGEATIWAVRLAEDGSDSGISYSVDTGSPEIYAPAPVSNVPISRTVSIYPYSDPEDYDPATDAFLTTPVSRNFSGIDVDAWVQEFFATFDTILSPEFSSSMLVIDARAPNKPTGVDSFLTALADQKTLLAETASQLMEPVYETGNSTRQASAQEALYQSLLNRLSNLYSVRAAVSFGATVSADIPTIEGEETPQLYGNLSLPEDPTNLQSLVTLTSPKMPLASGDNQPITFLLEAPQNLKIGGEIVSEITLDLAYTGSAIEHQIAPLPGVEGNYLASSWLQPIDGADSSLATDLGSVTVPILLRGMPATPRMAAQAGAQTNPGSDVLSDLMQWSYSFTYSLDFHYKQDGVHGTVSYNIQDSTLRALSGLEDAFQGLAQFVTSQSTLVSLITEYVGAVDATTASDSTEMENAALALGAFLKMVTDITGVAVPQASRSLKADRGAARSLRMSQRQRSLSSNESFSFSIEEDTEEFTVDGETASGWVITLSAKNNVAPPELAGDPVVQVEGYTAVLIEALSDLDRGIYGYAYRSEALESDFLQGETAQSISDRKVVLPGLQILAQQDAIASVYLTRNEDIGGAINAPFVYTTPEVSFANPYHPTITAAQVIDIASFNTGSEDNSLTQQLTALFDALFADGYDGTATIQLDVGYEYAFLSTLTDMMVDMPVAVLPPTQVKVGESRVSADVPALSEMISTVAAAIKGWAETFHPTSTQAELGFRLTIMSDLNADPMPLLVLMRLQLATAEIDPPLPALD